jgi:MFS transporter, DHA1 family, inner membrane transport protein
MPASEPVSEQPSDPKPAPRTPLKPESVVGRDEEGGGAGFGTQILLMLAITGFATCVTMLGPLLVDLSRDLDVSLGQAGLLAAAMAVTWALAAPFAGVLSDRFGRRPLIVMALFGLGAVTLGAGLAPDFGVLLVMRTLAGIFGGFGPAVVIAAAGDLFPPARRGMAMGWANLGFSMAAIIGVPSIGAIGGTLGWRWAFAATGLMVIGIGVLIRLTFPAPPRVVHAATDDATSYRSALRVPGLWSILAANVFERALFNMAVLYLPSFLMLGYGLDAVAVAPILVLMAVGSIVGTLGGGWLGDRLSKGAIFVIAQGLAAMIALILFTQTPGLAISAVGGAVFTLVNASSRPALLALSTELSARYRGAILGIFSTTNQAGIVLGSSVGGLAIGVGGYGALALAMAVDGVLASGLALPLLRRRRPAG